MPQHQSLKTKVLPQPDRPPTARQATPESATAGLTRALLVGVFHPRGLPVTAGPAPDAVRAPWNEQESLDELARLADSAGAEVVGRVVQHLHRSNPRSYVNEGKAADIGLLAEELNAGLVIVDDELSPQQQRGLEAALGGDRRVIDRTVLILDIFAQRAHTREGAVQVELAQLQYQLPRLNQQRAANERQRGGIGMRGPGETRLESDRRRIRAAISRLKGELKEIEARRGVQRAGRGDAWPNVALVGYTNAGKSTLLNRLAGAQARTRDQLFATLDPLTRRWELGEGETVLLTDTVGFIHKLPASLIAAFRATLEEVRSADLLIHVVNAAHSEALAQAEVARAEVAELGAAETPMITVLNKIDALRDEADALRLAALWGAYPDAILLSAASGEGCELLVARARSLAADWRRQRDQVPLDNDEPGEANDDALEESSGSE